VKRFVVIFFLIYPALCAERLSSQELFLDFESGPGKYRMDDLKEINERVQGSLPFEVKYISNFPVFIYYKPSLILSINKFVNFGITWSFHSTGSRISRKDYSGEYRFDTRIKTSSPGLLLMFYYPVGRSRICLNNEIGINYTVLNIEEYIKVYEESESDKSMFYGRNHYIFPSLRFLYPVSFFRIGVSAGYLVDFRKGYLQYSDNKEIILETNLGGTAYANWSGFRAGISISIDLLKKPVIRKAKRPAES
jgi:hypothetical protein